MPFPICRHLRMSGQRCKSPALRDERFCYFHTNLSRHHRQLRPNHVYDHLLEPGKSIRLAPIEDRDSLQMALSQTVGAIATNQIEVKQGVAVLYGLQQLASNMKQIESRNAPAPTPEELPDTVVKTVDHLYIAPDAPEATILEGQPPQLK